MIDWQQVARLQEDIGREDFAEVVRLFIEEVGHVVTRLGVPASPVRRAADLHFLRGSTLNLGFCELAELCHACELRARAGEEVDMVPVVSLYFETRQTFLEHVAHISSDAAA